jgi:hypothetical protein
LVIGADEQPQCRLASNHTKTQGDLMLEHTGRLMVVVGLGLGLFGCDKDEKAKAQAAEKSSGGDEGEAASDRDPYSTEGVAPGDSCKGIGVSDGLITCDGEKMLICSSATKYTWKLQMECKEGTECVVEGKGASCKKPS